MAFDPPLAANISDLWLTLAVSFRPPLGAAYFSAFTGDLAPDLAEMTAAAGWIEAAPAVAAFRSAAAAVPDPESLQVSYGRLFLNPPVPVPLNAGRYLDHGAIMGGSVLEMERAYRARGLEQADGFHDTPDHVSAQLEFLAEMAGRGDDEGTADFLGRFVAPWMAEFLHRLTAAAEGEPGALAYLALARILALAVAAESARVVAFVAAAALDEPALRRVDPARLVDGPGGSAHCRVCGKAYLRDKALKKLAAILDSRGLGTEHLDTCPDCREAVMGIKRVQPPTKGGGRGKRAAEGG